MAETHEHEAQDSTESRKRRYERPQISWEEEYKPAAFGLSCVKQILNLSCVPGPFSS